MLCEYVASGLISNELKQGMKKEIDDETKYSKGVLVESYNQFLSPILTEVTTLISKSLSAEQVVLFLHNKEIDHLYSFSPTG